MWEKTLDVMVQLMNLYEVKWIRVREVLQVVCEGLAHQKIHDGLKKKSQRLQQREDE